MRTTIDIDDDVLAAARERARQQNVALGKVISRLVREALIGPAYRVEDRSPLIAGFRPFASRGALVSDTVVNALRDQEGV